jgi:hypothetical protein
MSHPIRIAVFGSEEDQQHVKELIANSALDGDIVVCGEQELAVRGALENAQVVIPEEDAMCSPEEDTILQIVGGHDAGHVMMLHAARRPPGVEVAFANDKTIKTYPRPRRNKRAHYQR